MEGKNRSRRSKKKYLDKDKLKWKKAKYLDSCKEEWYLKNSNV